MAKSSLRSSPLTGSHRATLLVLLALMSACMGARTACAATTGEIFGWLEDEGDATLLRIERNGQRVAYDPGIGFARCDSVSILASAPAPVTIATADGSRIFVKPGQSAVTIGCTAKEGGVTRDLALFLQQLLHRSNQRLPQMAATRALPMPCGHPALDVPLLSRGEEIPSMVVGGRSSLLLTWVSTDPPVDVELRNAQGTVVAKASAVHDQPLRLKAPLKSDLRYHLRLTDKCGKSIEDDDVQAVSATHRPALPPELARLPEPQRTIFYADYLVGFGDGRWGLEALQLVGSLPQGDKVVEEWIEQWGSRP
jgi:hypothetical protein